MENPETSPAAIVTKLEAPVDFPGGWPQKIWFLWATVAIPLASFAIVLNGLDLVSWQDPNLSAWASLLVDRPGAMYFAPLALLVMVACCAIVFRPGPWVDGPYGRPALWLGVALGVQYSLLIPAIFTLQESWPDILAKWHAWGLWLLVIAGIELGTVGLTLLLRWLYRKLPLRVFIGLLVLLVTSAAVYVGFENMGERFDLADFLFAVAVMPFYTFGAVSLIAGPIWATDALLRLLWRLGRPVTISVPVYSAAAVAWLATWRFAVLSAIEKHESLPAVPPNCFLATAAARAPARLSGAFAAQTADGRSFQASPQLQHFKLFELALREISPGTHRTLRRIYDRLGPQLASQFSRPSSAALLWLTLKPFEAFAVVCLQILGGNRLRRSAHRIYRP